MMHAIVYYGTAYHKQTDPFVPVRTEYYVPYDFGKKQWLGVQPSQSYLEIGDYKTVTASSLLDSLTDLGRWIQMSSVREDNSRVPLH